jgi:hypothetical protein
LQRVAGEPIEAGDNKCLGVASADISERRRESGSLRDIGCARDARIDVQRYQLQALALAERLDPLALNVKP